MNIDLDREEIEHGLTIEVVGIAILIYSDAGLQN